MNCGYSLTFSTEVFKEQDFGDMTNIPYRQRSTCKALSYTCIIEQTYLL